MRVEGHEERVLIRKVVKRRNCRCFDSPPPKLCPKEQESLFGDPLKKAFGAPLAQHDRQHGMDVDPDT
jgi:hypothetical protein